MRAVETLSRVLISGIFIAAGVEKVRNRSGTRRYMQSKNMPMIPGLLNGAIAMELGVAPVLALGWRPRVFAPLLAAFLIPTSIIFHDFWNEEGSERKTQSANFFKNMAITGGLLVIGLRDFEKSKSRSDVHRLEEFRPVNNEKRPDYLDQAQFDDVA